MLLFVLMYLLLSLVVGVLAIVRENAYNNEILSVPLGDLECYRGYEGMPVVTWIIFPLSCFVYFAWRSICYAVNNKN